MALDHYFDALERLIANKPINVPQGSKIGNDIVALEAGRKRGSIKKSRKSQALLVEAIEQAKNRHISPTGFSAASVKKQKARANDYKEKYHRALNREVNYLNKIAELKRKYES